MHIVCSGNSLFNFCNFLVALYTALFHTRKDELHRRILHHGIKLIAEQQTQLSLIICPVRRKIMNSPGLTYGFGAEFLKSGKVSTLCHAYRSSKLLDTGQWTCPDNIVNVIIIGENIIHAIVTVKHSNEVFPLKTKEIQERTILSEPIGVIGIITWCFMVSLNDYQTMSNVFS